MYDAIIIGAGFAGLNAARNLRKRGLDNFLILEARDRVGGRVKPGAIAGNSIDLGGMWLGPSQTQLKTLANEYGAQTYATYLDGKASYNVAGKRYLGQGEDFSGVFSIREKLHYFLADRKIKKWLSGLDPAAPWAHPQSHHLDALTLEAWMEQNCPSQALKSIFNLICYSLFCAQPSQISMLFFLHYLKSGTDLQTLTSASSGGAQNFLFEGGVHQIASAMAKDMAHQLKLSDPVRSVSYHCHEVLVRSENEQYAARKVIIAVPATMVETIEFQPSLPAKKRALHRRLAMGSAIKYWVAYETPFWRDKGLNGSIFCDQSPASPCYDVTPPSCPGGLIAGFFDGDHALAHSDAKPDERQELVTAMLAQHLGPEALEPLDYQDNDWTTEEWSQGCYGAFAPPGVYAHYGQYLRPPIGPLHWAGTETSEIWTGYIEGALRSGERAAIEVACAITDHKTVRKEALA